MTAAAAATRNFKYFAFDKVFFQLELKNALARPRFVSPDGYFSMTLQKLKVYATSTKNSQKNLYVS